MAHKYNKDNLIYYASKKLRRVVTSVLGAKIFGLADAYGFAKKLNYLKEAIENRRKRQVLTYIEILFNVIIRNASTT